MGNIYSTQELINILSVEKRACLQGKRLNIRAIASGNPLIDRFIKSEGIQKFKAYQDFKAAIHQYQIDHRVSGIIWQDLVVDHDRLHFPKLAEDLISLPEDLEILKEHRQGIFDFWLRVTPLMDLYQSVNTGQDFLAVSPQDVEIIYRGTEWLNIWKWEGIDLFELVLQLGWGKPELAAYKSDYPRSGSQYIHAVYPGKQPIG
jgi:hypothetical protein